MRRVVGAALGVLLLAGAGCARSQRVIELKPAFSDDTVVGTLTARWAETGASRAAGENGAPEREIGFHGDVENRLSEPLYLRIRDVQLVAQGGTLPLTDLAVACAVAPGRSADLLRGSVWVPASQAGGVGDVRVTYFALPLSERGLAFYREFLLGQRPNDAAAIDAEIRAYASAPPCRDGAGQRR